MGHNNQVNLCIKTMMVQSGFNKEVGVFYFRFKFGLVVHFF